MCDGGMEVMKRKRKVIEYPFLMKAIRQRKKNEKDRC